MNHTEICICGHHTRRHNDTGIFTGWGMGHCTLCKCKYFECHKCIEDSKEIKKQKIIPQAICITCNEIGIHTHLIRRINNV